jgi:predicted nucleotidyltransferase
VESTEAKISEMVRRIVEQFQPRRVILFGSHARGTAGPDSDVDLFVVLDRVTSKREQRIAVRMALGGIGVAKDVVVASAEEVEAKKDLVGTIIYPALREGKILYERPG